MEDYSLTLSNDSAQVEQVQHGLESYLRGNGVRLRIASALNLALGEWLENIIQHAYGDGTAHTISGQCTIAPAEIVLRVTDNGRPFDPCAYPVLGATPTDAQQAAAGRGIHLIRNLMDRVKHERAEDKNVFTMVKCCPRQNDS